MPSPSSFKSELMTKKIKAPTLPTQEDKAELDGTIENSTDYVTIRGKRFGIRWLYPGVRRKYTHIVDKGEDDATLNCKAAALFVLNGFWKITFLYWFVWRWYYYVRQYTDSELVPLLVLGKKKVDVEGYMIATTLLTATRDDMMMMNRAEVEAIQAAQSGGNGVKSAKNDPG